MNADFFLPFFIPKPIEPECCEYIQPEAIKNIKKIVQNHYKQGKTGSLTLKLVLHLDELKNVNHVVLRGALVEVSGIQILFH